MSAIVQSRQEEFDAGQKFRELRRAVFEENRHEKLPALLAASIDLQEKSEARASEEREMGAPNGIIVEVKEQSRLLGAATTGLEVQAELCMSAIPTALIHLFEAASEPLVRYEVRNASNQTRRIRLITYLEGYSAQCVESIELESLHKMTVVQLPTFFPDRLATVTELTRASVNIEVQDLDARTEIHRTVPIWLLARTTAPLQVQNPSTGEWSDMTKYLGAFVTPNATAVMEFLPKVAAKHPTTRLVGYQVNEAEVASQVAAVFEALRASGIQYINSVIDFTPGTGSANQRVRLPKESLRNSSANCIDATVLVASLLEAISLHPAIVVVPGHAFVAWETFRNSGNWRYLETTMIPSHSFGEACQTAEQSASQWQAAAVAKPSVWKFRALRDLRALGVFPLE